MLFIPPFVHSYAEQIAESWKGSLNPQVFVYLLFIYQKYISKNISVKCDINCGHVPEASGNAHREVKITL